MIGTYALGLLGCNDEVVFNEEEGKFFVKSPPESHEVLPDIAGDKFHQLLEFCKGCCDVASLDLSQLAGSELGINYACGSHLHEFLQESRYLRFRKLYRKSWFCTYYDEVRDPAYGYAFDGYFQVLLYRFNGQFIDILKRYFDSLFLRGHNSGEKYTAAYPLENLCFFKNDKLFMGTLSHEYIAKAYIDTEEELDGLISCAPEHCEWYYTTENRGDSRDYIIL